MQELLSLMGITCQMHKRESILTSLIIVSEAFRPQAPTNLSLKQLSTKLILLASCQQTYRTYTIAVCTGEKLLMVDRGSVRNM